ncbi:VOC family protein [Nonomuraea jabiensis]|uniref:hypothetical protein n=1 Tax=Nonomuraea jabiensis TaxID=882448 RepID=UPI0036B0E058
MTVQRLDDVGIVVGDLKAAPEFFVELGLELEGEALNEELWAAARLVGLDDQRVGVAMIRTREGRGRIELAKHHTPKAMGSP